MNNKGIAEVVAIATILIAGLLAFVAWPKNSTKEVVHTYESANVPTKSVKADKEVTGFAPQTSEKSLKKIKELNIDLDRTIELNDEIGPNAIIASILVGQMDSQNHEPITILLDSPGGSVIAGARLISAMQTSKSKIRTVCLSLCASMAFMIHQYGDERLALDRAILMAHPASAGTQGDVDRMVSFLSLLQRYVGKMEAEIANRMGLTFEQYKVRTATEYWVDSEDAIKDHVVDSLVSISVDTSKTRVGVPEADQKVKKEKTGFDIIWIMPGYKGKE